MLRGDPGQDEKAGVVHDEVQALLTHGPADEVVAGRGLPRGCTEAEESEDATFDAGDVAQLCAGQGRVAEVVVAVDVLIPEP